MRRAAFLSVLLLTLTLLQMGWAQELASVAGVVADKTGAVVPDADVRLTDTKTNASYSTKTNSVGAYTFVKVLPGGGYKLDFSKDGFESLTISDIYVAVGTTHTQNATLRIGKITESVEVSGQGQSVTLDTTDATIGNNFDMRNIHELPIQARESPAVLIALQPGVVSIGSGAGSDDPNASRDGSVTGARSDQTNITLDGLDVNDFATGQSFSTVADAPVDSISDFRGETANPLAASGRGSGAQIQLSTTSGTNTFHGGIYEYHRDTATEANTVFNRLADLPRQKLIRNQFGAKLGGPVIKDKMFFFFNYQGRRDAREDSALTTVPLDSFRDGNIGYINNTGTCDENSRINLDPSCISFITPAQAQSMDPKGTGEDQALLDFVNSRYPHANDLTQGDGINTGGFRFNAPVYRSINDYVGRVDYNLTQKMKLFGRFSILRDNGGDDANHAAPFQFPGDPLTFSIVDHSYAYVVGHTWTISPTKVNQFFYGETRSDLNFPVSFNPLGTTTYSVFGPLTSPYAIPDVQHRVFPIPVFRDDFTWIRNKHNFQMGGTFKPIRTRALHVRDFNFVTLGIGGNLTSLQQNAPDSLRPSNIFRDPNDVNVGNWDTAYTFMLGRFGNIGSNFNNGPDLQPLPQGTGHTRNYRYFETEVYFQDTWRMRDDLTLTYGLRYQYYSVPYETSGLEAAPNLGIAAFFDPRAAQGPAGDLTPLPLISYSPSGKVNHAPGLYAPDYKDFAPRLAFAYNPKGQGGFLGRMFGDRKTVIRGGAGLIFDHPVVAAVNFLQDQASYLYQNASATIFGNPSPSSSLINDPRFTDINSIPAITAPIPVTVPFQPFVDQGVPVGAAQGQANYAVDPKLKTPYSIAVSFGFQRELPGNFQLETNYFGRMGRRLIAQADAGQVVNFTDLASGHTLSGDFAALSQEKRNGVSSVNVTPQPFFENQMNAALEDAAGIDCATAFAPFGLPNCTSFVAAAGGGQVTRGDLGDVLTTLDNFGVLFPGVGLHPQFGSNVYIANKSYSSYNALLTTLHKKVSHDLQFDVNYTFSHSIDNISAPANNIFGSTNFSGGLICSITNLRSCRGNSDFDVTHIVSGNFIYMLPFGRGKTFASGASGVLDKIIGGWQLSGIPSWRTGFAFTTVSNAFPVSFANDTPGIFIGTSADLKNNIHFDPARGFVLFADPDRTRAAFRGPLGIEDGTRNNLRGPSFTNLDLGLAKHFLVKERFDIEFRADAYNVFNHVNFGLPGTGGSGGTADISDPSSFGVINNAGAPRQMQFALRVDF